MHAEYFPMYGSFTNTHFCLGLYILNLSENILSTKFFDIIIQKWQGYPIFINVFCRESISDIN